jgi:polyhydroxybutyrate depolymerase
MPALPSGVFGALIAAAICLFIRRNEISEFITSGDSNLITESKRTEYEKNEDVKKSISESFTKPLTTALLFIAFTAAGCAPVISAEQPERECIVHVPQNYSPNRPCPLVLVLHGYSLSGDSMEEFSGFSELSEKEGFIAVYPDGTIGTEGKRGWNTGGSFSRKLFPAVDDGAYLVSLVRKLCTRYSIDDARIYVAGYSNGAFMAHYLIEKFPGIFAAIGCVAGSSFTDIRTMTMPVSAIHIHGLSDPVVPFEGNAAMASVASLVEKVRSLNGCGSGRIVMKTDRVTGELWKGKTKDAALYTIKGLGHDWPANEMNTAAVIWDFFKTYTAR